MLRRGANRLFRATTAASGVFVGSRLLSSPLLYCRALSTSSSSSPNIRWGILSAGKIASDFSKAVAITDGAEAHAVAARSLQRAQEFSDQHDVAKAYGSYEELLADPEIDVVYVGSVADQHAALAAQSIRAGKPTVVEKPLTLSYAQSKELIGLARSKKCFLMEGMWTRCFPATRAVQDLIQSGAIGRPVAVQGDFGWSTAECGPDDRIWFPDSGGMTLDIGMYMAQLGQVAFGSSAEIDNIQAMGTTTNGVDHTALANCMYRYMDNGGDHQTGFLQFYVTGEANTEERVLIQGTKGRIIMDGPAHVPQKIRVEKDEGRGSAATELMDFPLPDDSYTTWNYPGSIGFTYQIEKVGEALRKGLLECPNFNWNDSLQVAAMVDVIRAQVLRSSNNDASAPESERASAQ